ncbi:hypothetical protein BDB01DRAFT_13819 [Pilobolus umbonatus]|nr:hypothetical protein BDB01DRAFT_13819 [Pilobolus umbonatus]
MHLSLYVIPLFISFYNAQLTRKEDESPDFSISACTNTIPSMKKPRIAFISHDIVLPTLYHNYEQGSRDAANILDVDVEWNRYLSIPQARMAKDIYKAIETVSQYSVYMYIPVANMFISKGVDGIITSIVSDEVYEAVQYALKRKIPVIVFNSGSEYAQSLGLTRVLQDNYEAGVMIGTELSKRNILQPLIVQMDSLDKMTAENRIRGIKSAINSSPTILKLSEPFNNSSITMTKMITDHFYLNANMFDSIISLGGSNCADIVATAISDIHQKSSNLELAAGFFDIGGNSMTNLFKTNKNTFAVTQLPYYQTALPVFYMYLRILTGQDVYHNQTVKTGPNLVTNITLYSFLQRETNSLINIDKKFSLIGTIMPNIHGDTYNSALMAGITNLAKKLNWTVSNLKEENPLVSPEDVGYGLDYYANISATGIIIQTSNTSFVDYAPYFQKKQPPIQLSTVGSALDDHPKSSSIISSVGIEVENLARSVASRVISDGVLSPLCINEQSAIIPEFFCEKFYNEYKRLSKTDNIPSIQYVNHFLNISSHSTMESEFLQLLYQMEEKLYYPDAFITFSEYVFNIINTRILKGYMSSDISIYTAGELFDQNKAFLEGRVKRIWTINLFSIGFIALLHLVLDQMISLTSWKHSSVYVSEVTTICETGFYYSNNTTTSYCQDNEDNIYKSIQCFLCPENTYTDKPNQDHCTPCDTGYYSPSGSDACISCFSNLDDHPTNSPCSIYLQNKNASRNHMFMAIFIPIGTILSILIVGLILRCVRKQWIRQRSLGSDESWLLSYNDLVKPSLNNIDSMSSVSRQYLLKTNAYLLNHQADDVQNTNSDSNEIALKDTEGNIGQFHFLESSALLGAASSSTANKSDYEKSSESVTGSTKRSQNDKLKSPLTKPKMIRILGFHHNLPVLIKQIGTVKVKVDNRVRKEIVLMKNTRHPKLTEVVGLILEPQRTFIVEGDVQLLFSIILCY